jgi:hypothetical protein
MADKDALLADKRTKCLANIEWLEKKLMARLADWRIAARNMGSTYAEAYQRHTTIINQQTEYSALATNAAFGVLAMCSTGGLSVLSTLAQNSSKVKIHELLAEGLEDAMQTGLEAGAQLGAQYVAPKANSPASKSPIQFQNDLLNMIDDEEKALQNYLADLTEQVGQKELKSFAKIDVEAQKQGFEKYYKDLANKYKTPELVKAQKPDMLVDLEYGMWAAWIKANCVTITHKSTRRSYQHSTGRADRAPATIQIIDYSDPGDVIEEHFSERGLGITVKAGIGEDFGWITTDREVAKLVAWAERWSPSKKYGLTTNNAP